MGCVGAALEGGEAALGRPSSSSGLEHTATIMMQPLKLEFPGHDSQSFPTQVPSSLLSTWPPAQLQFDEIPRSTLTLCPSLSVKALASMQLNFPCGCGSSGCAGSPTSSMDGGSNASSSWANATPSSPQPLCPTLSLNTTGGVPFCFAPRKQSGMHKPKAEGQKKKVRGWLSGMWWSLHW